VKKQWSDWPSAQWDPNQWPQIQWNASQWPLCLGIQAMSGRQWRPPTEKTQKTSAPGGHQNVPVTQNPLTCFHPYPHIHPI